MFEYTLQSRCIPTKRKSTRTKIADRINKQGDSITGDGSVNAWPTICKFVCGAVVPIPTSPAPVIIIAVEGCWRMSRWRLHHTH